MPEEGDQVAIRCTILRGGTSKGACLLEHDIPPPGPLRGRLLERIMGTPDLLQIDGLGRSANVRRDPQPCQSGLLFNILAAALHTAARVPQWSCQSSTRSSLAFPRLYPVASWW